MKKLMIALTAVAAAALVAKADTDLGGSNFNGMKTGAFDVNVQESSKAYGEASYWALPDGATSESQVVEASADDKYLKIEETAVLERKINPDGTVDIPENGSVVISSKVQFTATEEEKVEPDGGAKLAIWLQKLEGAETATLMVTSGKIVDEEFKAVATPIEGVTVNENEWYDLVVTSTADKTGALAFTIKIGETVIPGTFNSLVPYGETGYATIASVGFKGTGAVDDIAFTAVTAELVDVTVNAEGVDLIDKDYEPIDESIFEDVAVGSTIKVYYEGALDDLEVQNATAAVYAEDDALVEITITVDKDLTVTITKKSGPTPEPITVIVPTVEGATATVEPTTAVPGAQITVTLTADQGKKFTNGETSLTVTGTLNADGSVTLDPGTDVTTEDIMYTLTLPTTVENATAEVTVEGEKTEAVEFKVGTTVVVTWTALTGYEITAGAEETIEMNADTTAKEPTVQAITYTIEYTYTDGEAAVEGVSNTNPTSYTIESETITIDTALISKDGYTVKSVDVTTIEKGSTGNKTITVTLEENKGGELPGEDFVEDKTAYQAWAAANGITTETEATTDQAADLAVAFLLGANKTADKTLAEAAQDKVDALITAENIDVSKLATGGALTDEFKAALAAKGLQAMLVPTTVADGLVATETAKFFKLVIKLAVQNAE